MATYHKDLDSLVTLSRALADPNRVRALLALRGRELCVCQLVELLELAPSTVSKHLTQLKQAGLVESRKKGRWVYYRPPDQDTPEPVRQALQWVSAWGSKTKTADSDDQRLQGILQTDLEVICSRQSLRFTSITALRHDETTLSGAAPISKE